jgi:site-specific recombinase XerD
LENGCTIHQVSKWLGHHDLSVTSIYLSGNAADPDKDPFA